MPLGVGADPPGRPDSLPGPAGSCRNRAVSVPGLESADPAAYGRDMEDLRQVAAFVAVAESLHIGRAAEALGLTRAVVSGRLRRLEAGVDLDLVDRSHRCRIALTPEGSALLPAARALLRAGRAFADEADAVGTARHGVVRVAITTERSAVLTELTRALEGTDGGWRVEVVETDPRSASGLLAIGGVEFVLSDYRLPATTRSGLPTPGPHRRERRDRRVVRVGDTRPVLVTWRTRWFEARDGRRGSVFRRAMVRMREAMFAGEPLPPAELARRRAWSRRCAADKEAAVRRRDEQRFGPAEARARAAARERRRALQRLWKGWVRGEADVCEFVDWMRERGVDPGLGMDPERPPRGARRATSDSPTRGAPRPVRG